MTEEPLFADHNVLSTYASMETARAAVGSLENHGIDAGHISLLGRQVEEAHEHRGTERDQAMLDKAAKTAVGGAATGSAVGGAVGLLAGLAAFGVPGIGPAVGAGIWATTLGGAAAGGGVGLAAAGYAKIKDSQAWELTYDSVSAGEVVVGVHSQDRDEVEKAAALLSDHDPRTVGFFDAQGDRVQRQRPVDPEDPSAAPS